MIEDTNYDIETLRYIGETRAKLYHKLDIYTIKDLLYHCPRTYIDLTKTVDIIEAPIDKAVAIKVKIINKKNPMVTAKRGLTVYKIQAKDETTADITITLFNEYYTFKNIVEGQEYIIYGKVSRHLFGKSYFFEMASPLINKVDIGYKFIPVYKLTAGLTSKIISRNVCDALTVSNFEEYLPDWILKEGGLISLNQALRDIHFPTTQEDIMAAKKRIVFDELFIFSLGLILIKNNNLKSTSFVIKENNLDEFYKKLPFNLTDAQFKVIDEIINDMKKNIPMNRLLQGDVGSGKTVVAMAAIYLAYKNGIQSAFMAPTEILAKQHFESINNIMTDLGLKVGLLVGSMTVKQKNRVKDKLLLGMLDIVVGTHAILQEDVVFKNLGLVITDEQHRFGVRQRAKLSEKGQEPHKLIMSATPIPRTLSMIIYGDLDISIIDKMPSNRKPILTFYVHGKKREKAYNFVKRFLKEGRQAYIVCPVIEQNDVLDLKSVLKHGEELKNNEFKDYKVEIIHGKTRAYDKDLIMQDFKDKKIDVLISTTVIEVGIDVPNAVVMVIEDAERFGLSQLHQLRGRVGRGEYQSYCLLISDTDSRESIDKLCKLMEVYDGFKISEYDLEIRGPGDFFGNRQHGLPQIKNFNMIKDVRLLKLSQDMVGKVLKDDINLEKKENQKIKKMVLKMIKNIGL